MDLWKGTFMADVEAIAQNGQFTEPDGDVAEGEEVIGEMTVGEKALYTFCERVITDLRHVTAQVASTIIEKGQLDQTLNARGAKLSGQLAAAKALMWRSIEDRLGVDSNIGIRKGYQIVKTPDQPAEDRPSVAVIELGILHLPGLR